MPLKFWTEALLTAAYLINRLLTITLKWKTPFELLYNKPATYAHLKTFGCLCYASNNLPNKTKFDSRSYKCVFLGYAYRQKGYKVYNLETETILISRDVSFYENVFPFESMKCTDMSCPLPIVAIQDDIFKENDIETDVTTETKTSTLQEPQVRKSTRITSKPSWLNDFVCTSSITESEPIHINSVAPRDRCSLDCSSALQEPKTYKEAQHIMEWREAMKAEINALEANGTWDLVKATEGQRTIGCRWIYKTKGYSQVKGEDYTDCFAPVVKPVTMRIFLATAVTKGWPIHHLDVNNAFLHGSLKENIYMDPPEGLVVEPGFVCKLKKSLYGLKQASREWNTKFTERMKAYGFRQSKYDYCLFKKPLKHGYIVLLVYVDDILLTAPTDTDLMNVKKYLDDMFTIKDLGTAKYFLGIEFTNSSQGLLATQHKYVTDIVKDMGLMQSKIKNTPLPVGVKLSSQDSDPLPDPSGYQAAVHLVKYLRGCADTGLFFPLQNKLNLIAFSDADWGGCLQTRKSLTGFCVFLGETPISWKTKKQVTVSRSTTEAEYRSLASTVCELVWITSLLREFEIEVGLPIPLFCDNKAAIHITANPVFHETTKHLDIDCHIVREKFKQGLVLPTHVKATDQVADIFTKSLPAPAFQVMKSKLKLMSLPSPPV
ncbi:UNVERIFIED_CONTAM: Retrovirus-related Pol polyprotein from transposon RE1 [Sesamum indicum]